MTCSHEVIFGGLCALCGTEVDQNQDSNATSNHIDMTHDASGITVSKKEAERIQKEDEARLLKARKLSLIVDLDQTILHAAWEFHIAEWVDKNKEKDSRAKDMSTFTLDGSKYTIKLRPGTKQFLQDMSKLYEMHVYTMGTRAYAKAVAAVIDPEKELFRDRILTRDENGSLTKKRLDRLFPADQSKVVVLDDRADVWDYSPNLIQIKPYEYFAGVGDINAPPNAQSTNVIPPEILKEDVNTTADVNSSEQGTVSEAEKTVNNKNRVDDTNESSSTVHSESKKARHQDDADSESSSESSSEESEDEDDAKSNDGRNVASAPGSDKVSVGSDQQNEDQQDSKPPNQLNANSKDASNANEKSDVDTTSTNTPKEEPSNQNDSRPAERTLPPVQFPAQEKPANNIPASFSPKHEDTDRILQVINRVLTDVHDEFYLQVDQGNPEPHVANILPEIKRNVLKDCTLVFSGVIPLHYRPYEATIWKMATAFGATCLEELTGKVTHLVAANAGTSKVNTARRYPHIKIVSPPWLMNSIWNFKRENEAPYIIPVEDVSSEVENPEEASLDFDEEEVELDMDWSDSEIDEALADDTGTEGNGTPLPVSSLEPSHLADEITPITPNASDDDDGEMNEDDWLGDVLDGMDDSEAEGDYGDVESVASASSASSSSSSKKPKRRLDNDDLYDQEHSPSSKRLK